jgi:predicted RecA/RadA family phage recombinase
MKNYVQDGKYLDFTAAADVDSGELVQVGSLHGVSMTAVANGARGVLALKGVFTLPKLTAAAGDATTAGGDVFFSSGSVSGSSDTGARKKVGAALTVAAQAATTVQVLLQN